jgi:hypothetical protein
MAANIREETPDIYYEDDFEIKHYWPAYSSLFDLKILVD